MADNARPDVETMRQQIMQAQMKQASPLASADPGRASPMDEVPLAVRVAVASAKSPADKIDALKQYYPDAVIRRTGGETVLRDGRPAYFPEREDILFTHPGTAERPELKGRLMRFDPAWYDIAPVLAQLGDIALGVNPAEYGKPGDNNTTPRSDAPAGILPSILGVRDTRPTGEKVMSAVGDTVATGLNAITGLGGGKAAQTGVRAVENIAGRRAATDLAGKEAAAGAMGRPEVLDAAARQSVPEGGLAPLATQGRELQSKFLQMARNPRQGNLIRKELDKVDNRLEQVFTESLEGTGGRAVSKGEVGAGVKGGLEDLETHVMKGGATAGPEGAGVFRGLKNQGALETAAVKAVGGEREMVPVPQLRATLQEMEDLARGGAMKDGQPMAADKSLFPSELADLRARIDANGGQLPMDYLRQKRSWMGENGGSTTMLPGNRPELERLYGDATDDLGNLFKAKGGKAYDLWEEGQSNYRSFAQRRDALRDIARSPQFEQAAEVAARGGTDAKTGLKRLDVLTESLGEQEVADLRRMKLSQIGMKGQGETAEFNAPQYLRGWGNTSDEMKDWLTRDKPELRQSLDDLYTLLKARQDFMGAKDPGTAAAQEVQKSMKGKAVELLMAPFTATGEAIGGKLFLTAESRAQLMTNPKFVKWLAEGGKLNLSDEAGMALWMGRLGALGSSAAGDAVKGPLREYVQALRQEMGAPQPEGTGKKKGN